MKSNIINSGILAISPRFEIRSWIDDNRGLTPDQFDIDLQIFILNLIKEGVDIELIESELEEYKKASLIEHKKTNGELGSFANAHKAIFFGVAIGILFFSVLIFLKWLIN